MTRRRLTGILGAASLMVALALGAWGGEGAATAGEAAGASDSAEERPRPIHVDGATTLAATTEVVRALWLADGGAARAALDRLEPTTRLLDPVLDAAYGEAAVSYARAYRTTIGRTRDELLRPDLEEAFNMFVWTQRTCMGCHAAVREAGFAAPPSSP